MILTAFLSPLPGQVTRHQCLADWCVWVRVWRLEYQDCRRRKRKRKKLQCRGKLFSTTTTLLRFLSWATFNKGSGAGNSACQAEGQRGMRNGSIHQAGLGHVAFANNSLAACTCFNLLELRGGWGRSFKPQPAFSLCCLWLLEPTCIRNTWNKVKQKLTGNFNPLFDPWLWFQTKKSPRCFF